MADFTVPPGTAEGVFAAAARLRRLAERTEHVRDTLGVQAASVVQALTQPRATEAAEAAGTVATQLRAVAHQTSTGAKALHDYGMALAAGVEAVQRSEREWRRHEDDIRTWSRQRDASPVADPDLEHRIAAALSQQRHLESDAEGARSEVRTAARRAAGVVDDVAALVVPGAGGLSPQEIQRRAMGAWAGIVDGARAANDGYQAFKKWYDPVDSAKALLLDGSQQVLAGRTLLRAWANQPAADLMLRQTMNLEAAKVNAVWRIAGRDGSDLRVLNQLRESGAVVGKVSRGAEDARLATQAGRSAFVDTVLLTTKFAKVTGFLSVVGGVYDIASPEHDGWRGWGDRGAGLLAVGGGGAALLATGGAIALGPVAAPVIAGALIVSAAWVGTNLVVDHWDDITHGVATAGKWVGGKAADSGRWVGRQASKAWKGLFS